MPRRALTVLAALLLAVVLTGAAPAAAGTGGHDRPDVEVHVLQLKALNGSGVHATVVLVRTGDTLRVVVTARGLTPSQVHMQHVHGVKDSSANATCPTRAADEDGDGIVSLAEGLPFYGPVLLPLTRPDGAYPTARRTGTVVFSERYTVSGDLRDLRDEVVVLHGMVVKGAYDMTVPVACGEIS